jgi:hypothetical protein
MNWLNIYTPILRSPEFIGSDPVARATWLSLLAYCVEQENGGVIQGCAGWKDRQWQQTCGVTRKEIDAANELCEWADDDLRVIFYPHDKEREVKAKRNGGRRGGMQATEAKAQAARVNGAKHNPTSTQAEPKLNPSSDPREGKGREGNGMEGEDKGKGKRVCFSPPSDEEVTAYASSIGYPMNGQAWCDSYAQKGWMVGKSKMKDWKAAVRNWKAQGWTPSVSTQQPRQPAPNSYEAQDQRRADELMKDEEAAQRIKAMFAPELAGFDNK